jgi:hypothetical protein
MPGCRIKSATVPAREDRAVCNIRRELRERPDWGSGAFRGAHPSRGARRQEMRPDPNGPGVHFLQLALFLTFGHAPIAEHSRGIVGGASTPRRSIPTALERTILQSACDWERLRPRCRPKPARAAADSPRSSSHVHRLPASRIGFWWAAGRRRSLTPSAMDHAIVYKQPRLVLCKPSASSSESGRSSSSPEGLGRLGRCAGVGFEW